MGEDDIMELLWKTGQVVPSSQTERATSVPPPILPGSGSGAGEGNAPLPLTQPPPPLHHQNLFIQEDEMASWLHHPYNRQGYFCSGAASSPAATQPQSSVSLAPPPPPYVPYGQIMAERRAENYMNFSTLRGNIFTGGRVEAGPLIPVVRESTPVGSSTFSTTGSYLTPATFMGGVSSTFAVPGRGRKDKAVAIQTVCDIAGTSSSCAEIELVQIQPAMETEIADERKRKEREETIAAIQGTEEARDSTSRKRSRVAEMHNLSERRRREKINERMKTLQELIPRCNKTDKASMLDDVIHYVKTLEMQIQMMSMGYGMTPPMMYEANTQQFIPHMAMGMNRPPPFVSFPGTPFPREAHTAGLSPSCPALHYPFPNIQASDPSRVPLPSLQLGSVSNQPQFPAYMNPCSQFVGLHQMQQPPPPLQNQTTSQLSFGQASRSKEHEDQDNQPTG